MDYLGNGLNVDNHIEHFGIKGQKWGHRRYQNSDGSLTPAGRDHYNVGAARISAREEANYKLGKHRYALGKKIVKNNSEINRLKEEYEYSTNPKDSASYAKRINSLSKANSKYGKRIKAIEEEMEGNEALIRMELKSLKTAASKDSIASGIDYAKRYAQYLDTNELYELGNRQRLLNQMSEAQNEADSIAYNAKKAQLNRRLDKLNTAANLAKSVSSITFDSQNTIKNVNGIIKNSKGLYDTITNKPKQKSKSEVVKDAYNDLKLKQIKAAEKAFDSGKSISFGNNETVFINTKGSSSNNKDKTNKNDKSYENTKGSSSNSKNKTNKNDKSYENTKGSSSNNKNKTNKNSKVDKNTKVDKNAKNQNEDEKSDKIKSSKQSQSTSDKNVVETKTTNKANPEAINVEQHQNKSYDQVSRWGASNPKEVNNIRTMVNYYKDRGYSDSAIRLQMIDKDYQMVDFFIHEYF